MTSNWLEAKANGDIWAINLSGFDFQSYSQNVLWLKLTDTQEFVSYDYIEIFSAFENFVISKEFNAPRHKILISKFYILP